MLYGTSSVACEGVGDIHPSSPRKQWQRAATAVTLTLTGPGPNISAFTTDHSLHSTHRTSDQVSARTDSRVDPRRLECLNAEVEIRVNRAKQRIGHWNQGLRKDCCVFTVLGHAKCSRYPSRHFQEIHNTVQLLPIFCSTLRHLSRSSDPFHSNFLLLHIQLPETAAALSLTMRNRPF